MGWLDKLKALINIELNAPLINVTKSSDNSNVGKEYMLDEETGELKIIFDNLPEDKQKKLKLILKENVEEGNKLLEDKSSSLLKDLIEFQKTNGEDKKVLDFFQNIIPMEDLEALESSLYLRKKFIQRQDVKNLKEDIRTRFGDRGNNIANLCTAGYFENFLMPLFNSSQKDFKRIYDVVVSKSAMAVFVHSQMSDIKIAQDIKMKLEISKKYGIKFLHIHGIGDRNIRTIKKCVEDNKELFNFYNKEIFENGGIIIVELIL
jgi:hypothetical protein